MKIFIALAVAAELILLFGDLRVLVSERRMVAGKDNVTYAQDTLACQYFTGRGFVENEFWYAAGNIGGRDSCPFVRRM